MTERMSFEITPITEPGKRFVSAAEGLVGAFRDRAHEADEESEICTENFTDMQAAGIASAFVPASLGGFGLTSVHDWITGISRLARGDGSAAIAINMHLAVSRALSLVYSAAEARGSTETVQAMAPMLEGIVSGDVLFCATATERGTDNLHPMTRATRVEEGWEINGTKIFVTLSPIASHIAMFVRMAGEEDSEDSDMIGTVMMPMGTQGIFPQDDWDALGMRASGSQSVVLDGCLLPPDAVRPLAPWGRWSPALLVNRTLSNIPLLGAFLGIAEAAHGYAIDAATSQAKVGRPVNAERPGIQHSIAEMEIEMAKCRAVLSQGGLMVDRFLDEFGLGEPPLEAAHALMKDFQAVKWVVNKGAIDIVGKAMDIAGGAGYLNRGLLARLYRDVRAGPFMQPFAPTEARDYVGKVALGIYPES